MFSKMIADGTHVKYLKPMAPNQYIDADNTIDSQSPPNRCLLIVLDGLADRSYPELNNQTPLQAARTPHLDRLAALGANGMHYPYRPGFALPSEDAHFLLFGYHLNEIPDRGFLEALGAGIAVEQDGVAILSHLVCAQRQGNQLILDRDRPALDEAEVTGLTAAIGNYEDASGHRVAFRQTRGLDGIITISGPASPALSDTHPFYEQQPILEPLALERASDPTLAKRTARVLKNYLLFCHRILSEHEINIARRDKGQQPVNALVSLRAARPQAMQPFGQRWGLRAASFSSGILYAGICRALGFVHCDMPDGDDLGQAFANRLLAALKPDLSFDFCHVHTKAPDVAGHTKNPHTKVQVIEQLDLAVGQVIDRLISSSFTIMITADHATPSGGPLIHSGEAVPLLLLGPGIRRDAVEAYDEISCSSGALGFLRGRDIMPLFLNAFDRTKMHGLMDAAVDQPFWPGNRTPFTLE